MNFQKDIPAMNEIPEDTPSSNFLQQWLGKRRQDTHDSEILDAIETSVTDSSINEGKLLTLLESLAAKDNHSDDID